VSFLSLLEKHAVQRAFFKPFRALSTVYCVQSAIKYVVLITVHSELVEGLDHLPFRSTRSASPSVAQLPSALRFKVDECDGKQLRPA
jgi:hypothetical protein